ncbi:wax ester/triacylglycerol synthase family O-acyltransferase [Patulibacter sp.]|uniref:WS/DGAT/MGAT family O-acyltransferase n=1 Tax=Patulibacter sp. TaxID=1912859 RepID=UPI002718D5E5|nr:wax ester/triacylglycerol synthase family O-acyltransferase [Patulibacter sp.]MDO9410197.1 wax ester/triacylglycerol synthase family O-acyltransferase [Patulibacter sp.]
MRLLKPADAVWLLNERRDTPAHVGGLMQCSKPEGAPASFVTDLVRGWRRQATFRSPFNLRPRIVPLPAWEELRDDEIDLDYHLRHSALPRPGGERELGVLISRLHSHPLDRHRPLWECHVIEGLADDRFAVYWKFHHSQLDGMAAMGLMDRVLATDGDERGRPPLWAQGTRRPRRTEDERADVPGRDLAAQAQALATAPLRTGRAALGWADSARQITGVGLRQIRETVLPRNKDHAVPFRAPRTVLNGTIHAPRRFATQHYPVARLKEIARAHDATINDVLLGLCGGALRRYLDEHDTLPSRSLVATLPVSVRAQGDDGGGNAITFIHSLIGTDEADHRERMRKVVASTAAAKALISELPRASMDAYTMLLMGPYLGQLALGLGARGRPMHNIVISNVRGPAEPRYVEGARVDEMFPVSLLFDGQALNITAVSYAGEFCIGFTGCRDSLASMQRVAVYCGETFDALDEQVGAPARDPAAA